MMKTKMILQWAALIAAYLIVGSGLYLAAQHTQTARAVEQTKKYTVKILRADGTVAVIFEQADSLELNNRTTQFTAGAGRHYILRDVPLLIEAL